MPQPKRETPIQPEAIPSAVAQGTPPPPTAATAKRWYQGWGNRLTLATLILPVLWPIAPIIIWLYSSWSKKAKIILTIIFLVLSVPLIEILPMLTSLTYEALVCKQWADPAPPATLTQGIYGRFTYTDDVMHPFQCLTRVEEEDVIVLKKQSVEVLLTLTSVELKDPTPLAELFRFLSTEELERAAIKKMVASGGKYTFMLDPGDYILCGKFYAGYACTQTSVVQNQTTRIDLNQAFGQLHFTCQNAQCQESLALPTAVSSWRTYRNGELGFQIDMPANNFYLKTETSDGKRLVKMSNHPGFEENEFALVITIDPNVNSNFRPSSDPQIISLLDRIGYSRLNKNWDGKLEGNFLGDPPRGYYDVVFPNSETPEKDIIIRAQIHRIDELSESEGGSNGRLAKITSQMLATFRFLEVRRISQLNPDRLGQIPQLTLPEGLEEAQLTEPQKIADTYYVKFLKGNMNIPVNSAVKRSGMLYADEGDTAWKILYEVRELSSYSNNPYFFWNEGDQFYTIIIDSAGAGSGEGEGKLVKLDTRTDSWQIVDCFYYVPESFTAYINNLSEDTPLSQGIISYDEPFEGFIRHSGRYVYDTTLNKFVIRGRIEEACTAFNLEL